MRSRFAKFCIAVLTAVVSLFAGIYFVWTGSPPPQAQERFDTIAGCAYEKGFKFRKPILRHSHFDLGLYGGITYPFNFVPGVPAVIEITKFPASDYLYAHEIAHAIDFETGRKGHPFFHRNGNHLLQLERFADELGYYILSGCSVYRGGN